MKKKPYKRKPGDLEIRVLKNGKVVMLAPDELLMEVARVVHPNHYALPPEREIKENAGFRENKAE